VFKTTINNIEITFKTAPELFSPNGADLGTLAMLSVAEFKSGDKVLDLGCGYGICGVYAAKLVGAENVFMSDISVQAVKIAQENTLINGLFSVNIIHSDGFSNISETGFTKILSNPPYHTDFNTAKHFIEKGFNRMTIGGKMYMVTKRRDWYKNKLISVFGGVLIDEINGYFIFTAEKRSVNYARK
jgi:16S rRNA (guanine1207-N2)-methyltransferase